MNYNQTIEYLYNALPVFHRIGAAAYKPDLGNVEELCALAGNPHLYIKCIHVAGTNGKGSVSHMLASVLQEAGYKTGLYTSPHLKDFRERIRINGTMISRPYVVKFVEQYKKDFKKISPSFFEMTVMLAFKYFHERRVDIAVVETGLGGRLDSTNIISPMVSVITNIGWDHMNLLGNTLNMIAAEKAGIIKPGVPAVLGEGNPQINAVFKNAAKKNNSKLYIASHNYKAELLRIKSSKSLLPVRIMKKNRATDLMLDLTGHYQLKNVVTVLQTIEVLPSEIAINEREVVKGLLSVKANTGLAGRWQKLGSNPLIYVDTGHNVDGIREVLKMIRTLKYRKLHFILGMVNDKSIDAVLAILPKDAEYYFCKANIPRGLDAELLRNNAAKYNLNGNIYSSVKAAYSAAKSNASAKDLIFAGGSTFTVAEVI